MSIFATFSPIFALSYLKNICVYRLFLRLRRSRIVRKNPCGKICRKKAFSSLFPRGAPIALSYDAAPANGYCLTISEGAVSLRASDQRGFVYGAESLIKLIDSNTIPACSVDERPRMPFRGVHLFLPSSDQIPFTKRLIKYLLSPMGYNYIIFEVAGGMKFSSHPEISAAFEKGVAKGKSGEWLPFPHGAVADGKPLEKARWQSWWHTAGAFGSM